MKQKICLLVLCMILLSLVGCTSQKDFLKFHSEKTGFPNKEMASYEVNIGTNVGGASLVAELWMDGACIKSETLTLNHETETISMIFSRSVGETEGLNIQIDTDEQSASLLTYFELPKEVMGYSFTAYEDQEVIPVTADEERLLAAMAFDIGSGVRVVDCESLLEDPQKLNNYSCIVVIRAVFTADRIDPQAEVAA